MYVHTKIFINLKIIKINVILIIKISRNILQIVLCWIDSSIIIIIIIARTQ